jgi:hypothetical protein
VILSPPHFETRLQSRYVHLVKEHLHAATSCASGLSALPGLKTAFASTQAAWRSYTIADVALSELIKPLPEAGREGRAASATTYVLLVHDRSTRVFGTHKSEADRIQLTHQHDIGYELSGTLLVDAATGRPPAPMEIRLLAAERVHNTRTLAPKFAANRLDQLETGKSARHAQWSRALSAVYATAELRLSLARIFSSGTSRDRAGSCGIAVQKHLTQT